MPVHKDFGQEFQLYQYNSKTLSKTYKIVNSKTVVVKHVE